MPRQPLGLHITPHDSGDITRGAERHGPGEVSGGRRAAVLGRPIAHSLSPALHSAAYQALHLPWTFTAIDVGEGELSAFLASRGPSWVGFACTMPLKHDALSVASTVTPVARAVGAANTLVRRADGDWAGDNTDVAGIVAALHDLGHGAASTATVVGAGGTAQAAVVALAELGVSRCTVQVRDATRTAGVRATARRAGVEVEIRALGDPPGELVISTLPPRAADRLAADWHAAGALHVVGVLLDVVYAPWPTALAGAVGAAGGTVIGGAVMLLHQAAAQVELMTGRPAPLDAMRAALTCEVSSDADGDTRSSM